MNLTNLFSRPNKNVVVSNSVTEFQPINKHDLRNDTLIKEIDNIVTYLNVLEGLTVPQQKSVGLVFTRLQRKRDYFINKKTNNVSTETVDSAIDCEIYRLKTILSFIAEFKNNDLQYQYENQSNKFGQKEIVKTIKVFVNIRITEFQKRLDKLVARKMFKIEDTTLL